MVTLKRKSIILLLCIVAGGWIFGAILADGSLLHSGVGNTAGQGSGDHPSTPDNLVLQSAHSEVFEEGQSEFENTIASKSPEVPSAVNFPIGWYDSVRKTRTPTKVAREGINLLMPYVGKSSNEEIMAYLDAAEKAGLKVLLEIRRTAVEAGDADAVTRFIRAFREHPAIYGWHLYDEPAKKIPPKTLKRLYNAIKSEDPERPVAIVFAWYTNMVRYRDAMDIFMFDTYPIKASSQEFSGFRGGRFREWQRKAAYFGRRAEEYWFVLQAFGEGKDGKPQFNRRLPTAGEMRYMLYTAVLAPADGIFFWTHYRSKQSWINEVLTPIVRELHQYIPAIQAGPLAEKARANQRDIQIKIYKVPQSKKHLIVAIHHNKGETKTEISLDRGIQANSVRSMERESSAILSHHTIKDTLGPYSVQIYEIE